jgi:hypothetical protein
LSFAKIGYGCEAPRFADSQPGSTCLQVASGEDGIFVRPPMCILRRSAMRLIAIAGYDQSILRMYLPGEYNKAHYCLA